MNAVNGCWEKECGEKMSVVSVVSAVSVVSVVSVVSAVKR